jgi:hypothetical protein
MFPKNYLVLKVLLQCHTPVGQPEMLSFIAIARGLLTIVKAIRHL